LPSRSTLCPYTTLFRSPLGRLVQENVRHLRIADRDHADFVRLDLEDAFDRAFQRVLERDDAVRGQTQRRDGLNVQRVGKVRGPRSEEHTSELQSRSELV